MLVVTLLCRVVVKSRLAKVSFRSGQCCDDVSLMTCFPHCGRTGTPAGLQSRLNADEENSSSSSRW